MTYHLTIEGNPISINQTYRAGKGRNRRKIYIASKARLYGDKVGWQARANWRHGVLADNLEVTYKYYFRDKKLRDHLNFNKLLNDSLNKIVWRDDNQIKISHHYTLYDKDNPRIELEINII